MRAHPIDELERLEARLIVRHLADPLSVGRPQRRTRALIDASILLAHAWSGDVAEQVLCDGRESWRVCHCWRYQKLRGAGALLI